MQQTTINLSTTAKTYSIFINDEPIENLFSKLSEILQNKKSVVVISDKVNKLYGKKIKINNSIKFVVKDGEKEKNFDNYKKILNFVIKNKLERKDAIIAIGGGVVGDIAGFVASTYLRGVDFIQIPTTLLACVDSSVGGKTAINSRFGKNLIGTFYQPSYVFCNLNFLETLDERQFMTGLAEVLKYAFIEKNCMCENNYNFYNYLKDNFENIIKRDKNILAHIIKVALELKKSVVQKDEKENGLRRILNFGHTFAHSIEKITNYKKYTHGEAVYIGMIMAFNLSFKLGKIDENIKNNAVNFITKFYITERVPKFGKEKLLAGIISDKKIEEGKINFILPSSINTVEIIKLLPEDIINNVI